MDPVVAIFDDAKQIVDLLDRVGQVSYRVLVADHMRRVFVMAAASHFEQRLIGALDAQFSEMLPPDHPLFFFARARAIAREYHRLFSWRDRNANAFFGLFGSDYKRRMEERVRGDSEFAKGARAFLEIGNLRNELAHENFATYVIEKTMDELLAAYHAASLFVDALVASWRD